MGLVHSVVEELLVLTTISAPKIDLYPCTTLHAEVVQSLHIKVPGFGHFLKMGMRPSDMTLGVVINGATQSLAKFKSPYQDLHFGLNRVNWDVGASVTSIDVTVNDVIMPMFVENKVVDFVIQSNDIGVEVTALGFAHTFSGLTFDKTLSCRAIGQTPAKNVSNSICHPASGISASDGDSSPGYSMECSSVRTETNDIVV